MLVLFSLKIVTMLLTITVAFKQSYINQVIYQLLLKCKYYANSEGNDTLIRIGQEINKIDAA